ncbi:nuclease [Marinomonas ushuaiensis DSM 15871]|uniref:Nuclease SbcCD subunit D n=1 Tax=Marinomonas ushuaiensis DSM 15871 TaxID=1122207 RepID=X7E6I9_9GAMM|nr:exonuclease SbcCD subunit D C-terminal domain-containing protein [Marinomonas ushuaiensis]ETX11572.1 nuclease [Marinomonas ushuaiensis DSM 15871]
MKILHTSDWHLGQHFMGKSRRDEHKAFIDWLLALVDSDHIDAVIIAGDIFDTGSPPSYAREMYHQLVLDMKARACQLVIVAGNHDSVSMLNESKSLLSYLDTQVSSQANLDDIESHVIPLMNKQGEISAWVCAVPYLRPKDVMKSLSGQSEQDKKMGLLQHISDFYQQVYLLATEKNKTLKTPVPIIGTGHLTAMGGQVSESVRDLYVGTLEALPTSVFPAFDYLALGHIHRAQAITKNGRFRYSGSPIPLSFDELGREKTLVIVDTDLFSEQLEEKELPVMGDLFARESAEDKIEPIRLVSIPMFQPMASLKGSLKEVTKQLNEQGFVKSFEPGQTLWLEVTIVADDYLSDVQKRIMEVIDDKPIELLRVMRKSALEKKTDAFESRQTLSELTVSDVFEKSLQANLDIEEEEAKTLTKLFNVCLTEMEESQNELSDDIKVSEKTYSENAKKNSEEDSESHEEEQA